MGSRGMVTEVATYSHTRTGVEEAMGRISHFAGRCQTEISFLVGEQPFRAVMVKQRNGSHHGQDSGQRTEEVVIRLWMGETGVVVQSSQEEEPEEKEDTINLS